MPNYFLYRVFTIVARDLSLTKAARYLNLTPSAVSHDVSKLEDQLGIKLFLNEGKKLLLTKKGEYLFSRLEPLFDAIDEVDRSVNNKSAFPTEVTIATTHTFLNSFILPHLNWTKTVLPKCNFRFETTSMLKAEEMVRNGEADVGVILLYGSEMKDLISYPVAEIREVLATKAKGLDDGALVSLEQLSVHPLITIHSESQSFEFYQKHFNKDGWQLRPEIQVRQLDTLCELLKSTDSVGIIYDYLLTKLQKEDANFREVRIEHPIPPRTLAFVLRRDCSKRLIWERYIEQFKSRLS
jgi:DNA-binding transcriptional LysR family regulator